MKLDPKRVAFFYEHAGYPHDPKTETPEEGRLRSARLLAYAEDKVMLDMNVYFEWENESADPFDLMDAEVAQKVHSGEWEWKSCVLRKDDGEVLASLGGITLLTDRIDPFRDVVDAELALEAGYGPSDLELLAWEKK